MMMVFGDVNSFAAAFLLQEKDFFLDYNVDVLVKGCSKPHSSRSSCIPHTLPPIRQ